MVPLPDHYELNLAVVLPERKNLQYRDRESDMATELTEFNRPVPLFLVIFRWIHIPSVCKLDYGVATNVGESGSQSVGLSEPANSQKILRIKY